MIFNGTVVAYNGRMTSPQDQRGRTAKPPTADNPSVVVAVPGQVVTCTVETATDNDKKTVTANGQTTTTYPADGTVTYKWSAVDANDNPVGTFANAAVASTTWTAPDTAGVYVLKCKIDDPWADGQTPAVTGVTEPETGKKNDAALVREVEVDVVKVSIKYPHGNPAVSAASLAEWQNLDSANANEFNERDFEGATRNAKSKLNIYCQATVLPAGLSEAALKKVGEKLRWTVEDVGYIKGEEKDWVENGVVKTPGIYMMITLATTGTQGLPSEISTVDPADATKKIQTFGTKVVGLYWEENANTPEQDELLDKTNVEIFYPKEASSHGGGQVGAPNWYHYWMQTNAGKGYENVVWDESGTGPGAIGFASFVNGAWVAHVGTAQNSTPQYGRVYGIDVFANIVRHENQHVINDSQATWWPNGYDSAKEQNQLTGRDKDKDLIPDALEPTLDPVYNAQLLHTYDDDDNYGAGWKDNEHYTKYIQPKWTKGSANKEDWGYPGMQHQTNDKYDD